MQALSNIRVVDLTHVIAGPFCTYQLAVMGADVIKVEIPSMPDMSRATSTEFPSGEKGLGPWFIAQNANKRAIAVDLKTDQGREIIRKLISTADVLVENYRSGALAEIGLGYEDVRKIKDDIIYCSMTGFGQSGPKGQHTAYDNVIQAFSGLMSANGDASTSPVKIGPPILDYGTGIQAAYAIACALYQRTHTDKGQHIDVAMLDAALMLMSSNVMYYAHHGKLPALTGNQSAYNAGYCCYEAKDAKLMLGAFTGNQVAALWRVLGDEDYGERFLNQQPPAMEANYAEDRKRIASLIANQTADHWEKLFNENKVPAARVRKLDEALNETQLNHRAVLQKPSDIDASDAKAHPTAAFSYEQDGPVLQRHPPEFAQHAHDVLCELGYSQKEIDQLADGGIVALHSI